ncbi:MAG: UDP-N-acetylmuramoyl-L-alanine--D-glutamate ligase [Thermodesulfobacteriota bacterium]
MIESCGEIAMSKSESGGGGKIITNGPGPSEVLAGRKVLVVGLGVTGFSVARFLVKHGAVVRGTDIRDEERLTGAEDLKEMGLAISAGGFKRCDFLSAELIVISPGIAASNPLLSEAREKGIEVIGDLELASRFMDVPIIAIAGTNGKSTVTSLIGEILEASGRSVFVGGNIGTPVCDYFLKEVRAEICVLEVSSFQLESIVTFSPHIALLLNITEDHLERYSGFAEYAAVKFRVFDNQKSGDFAVVNAADAVIDKETLGEAAQRHGEALYLPFNRSNGAGIYYEGKNIVFAFEGRRETYCVEAPGLKGAHNMENAMAAVAALRLSGVSREDVSEGLRSFKGLRHRMELIGERGGVSFVDDSKGTNTGALLMALKSTPAPVILIAGGRDKHGDYGVLNALMADKVRLLLALGEAGGRLSEAFTGIVEVRKVSSMEEAVETAAAEARPGETVLLSPACSSFDMFRDFKERGDRFAALVRALPER